jgi:hypothetical protein
MSDFSTGDFILQPVKPKPEALYEVFRIGANAARFYYSKNGLALYGPNVTLHATLHDVSIVLSNHTREQSQRFYDIHCTYGDDTVTCLHEHEWAIGGTLSSAIATIRKLSSLEAYHMGLSVAFHADATRIYETYSGYIRVCHSHDRQLFCYAHAEDESDIADVEWRYKQDAAGLLALGYGVYESAFFKAGKAHLRRVLSYIEEVKQ